MSITITPRKRRPSVNCSDARSSDQRRFATRGMSYKRRLNTAHSRPLRRRAVRYSRRQIRWTRSPLTTGSLPKHHVRPAIEGQQLRGLRAGYRFSRSIVPWGCLIVPGMRQAAVRSAQPNCRNPESYAQRTSPLSKYDSKAELSGFETASNRFSLASSYAAFSCGPLNTLHSHDWLSACKIGELV